MARFRFVTHTPGVALASEPPRLPPIDDAVAE
jgi:hypothetical protein